MTLLLLDHLSEHKLPGIPKKKLSVCDLLAKHRQGCGQESWLGSNDEGGQEQGYVVALCSLSLQTRFSTSFEIHLKQPHLQRAFPVS